jgi:protein-S-isoprenylcysteine O-methyltransferase Ste14
MPKKSPFVRLGDFFFKYRNVVFPLLWCALFLAFVPAPFSAPRVVGAIALVALGLVVRGAVIGFAYIKRGGVNKEVYADTLVTEGFFTACRNPLYVGNMLIYIGVFLMHGNPAVVLLGTFVCALIYQSIIAAEEYFLRNKFGESYAHYCRDVPRWWIKLQRLPAATAAMQFNFKRVLMKDYSTIANALVTLLFLNALRHYHYDAPQDFQHALVQNATAITAILLFAAMISRAKKLKLLTL